MLVGMTMSYTVAFPESFSPAFATRGDVVIGQVRHEVVVLVGGVLHDEQPANGLRGGLGLLLGSGGGLGRWEWGQGWPRRWDRQRPPRRDR